MADPAPKMTGGRTALAAGERLGPYEILAPLGAGGMGEVYRARDTRLGREVAIKIISDRIAQDSHSLRRFEKEAKAVAALSHPNILAIYDFNTENGISFAVMELLRGESLADRLAREKLSWRKAVEITAAVADGLASAHGQGIIHRDLKPANIFLTSDGQVKILDFGLAKRQHLDDSVRSSMATESQPGQVVGTIGYMSPEQVSGAPVDARSDIFALGCLLYEMISGERAFARPSAGETMAAILRDNPRDLSESGRASPPAVAEIVRRCLQKSADERFQSARDLAFNLRAVSGEPAREAKPRSRVAVVAGLGAIVLVIAVAAGLRQWRPTGASTSAPKFDSLAVLPFVNSSHDPQSEFLAEGMTDTIINKLAELPQLKVMSRSTMFRFKGKDADAQQIGRELKVGAVLTGRILKTGDRLGIQAELVNANDGTQLWGERYDRRMADVFALQDDIAQQISQKLRLKLTGAEEKRLTKRYTEDPEAYSLYVQGRFYLDQRTGPSIRKAIELFNAALQRDPNYSLGYVGIADSYAILHVYGGDPYLPTQAKAKEAAVKALAIDPDLAEAHATLGLIQGFSWQWQDAEAEFRRAIALKPNYANAHHWYAFALQTQRRFAQALVEYKKAQALDPLSAINNTEMAESLSYTDRNAEAIELLRRTIDFSPAFRLAHATLGELYIETGDSEKGLAELQKLGYTSSLGKAYAQLGRREDALQIIAELKQKLQRNEASPLEIASVYARLGDRPSAYHWFDQALREHEVALMNINSDRFYDPWRAEPHFQQLLRGMNLAN